jgi:hypothetical protein
MSYLADAFTALLAGAPTGSRSSTPFTAPIGAASAVGNPSATSRDVPPDVDDTAGAGPDTIARYPDGTPILGSNGMPMQKPPFADLGLALQRAQDLASDPGIARIAPLINWLRGGGAMDYQQSAGHPFNPAYQDFSNYVFGGATSAAGIPPYIAVPGGIGYNAALGRLRPGLLGTPWRNIQMWDQGRNDYLGNRLAFPGVAPAPAE